MTKNYLLDPKDNFTFSFYVFDKHWFIWLSRNHRYRPYVQEGNVFILSVCLFELYLLNALT